MKKYKFGNFKFTVTRKLAEVLTVIVVIAVAIFLGNSIFAFSVLNLVDNEQIKQIFIICGAEFLLCEVKDGYALYKDLNYHFFILNLEIENKLRDCNNLVDELTLRIKINKERLDLLKALSPISVVVLLVGFLIDRSKQSQLDYNYFVIILVVVLGYYFLQIYRSWSLYCKFERQLQEAQNAIKNINESLVDNSKSRALTEKL
jgi:hypothetical protein